MCVCVCALYSLWIANSEHIFHQTFKWQTCDFSLLLPLHFARVQNGSRAIQFLNKNENCHDPFSTEKKRNRYTECHFKPVESSEKKGYKMGKRYIAQVCNEKCEIIFRCQPSKSSSMQNRQRAREKSHNRHGNSILLTAICKSLRMALLLPVPQYAMANVYIPDRRSTGSLSVVKLVTSGSASSKRAYIVNAIPTAKPRKIFSCCVSCAYCERKTEQKDRN